MVPWMGALEDNLEVLNHTDASSGTWGHDTAQDIIRSRIRVKSMSFMRGRTFLNRFLIIDEAQNLSPKQMKTLITRAGPGTKIVCMGNIAQIDTPYLTEGSSGLTYVVDKFKGWAHAGHITLQRGERSHLADFAFLGPLIRLFTHKKSRIQKDPGFFILTAVSLRLRRRGLCGRRRGSWSGLRCRGCVRVLHLRRSHLREVIRRRGSRRPGAAGAGAAGAASDGAASTAGDEASSELFDL